jgi:hypothetical protein
MADPPPSSAPTLRGAAARGARFAALCVAATIVLLALVWVFGGFTGLGLDTSGAIALSLGIVFTVALAVGLMALIFYGDRER